jgi:soluble lytic murein transglycosylase-like protein
MDATATAVAFMFVIMIFSSLGGNTNRTGSYKPTNSFPSGSFPSGEVFKPQVPSSIEPQVGIIEDQTYKDILQFILRFRKPEQAQAVAQAIVKQSQTYGVNPKLVTALMRRESGFNPYALSSSGAMGLGQLLPSTCKTTGVTDPYDIDDNAKGTVRYMKYLLDKFKNSSDPVMFALAGYLEGPNNVARNNGYSAKTAGYVQDIVDLYHKI